MFYFCRICPGVIYINLATKNVKRFFYHINHVAVEDAVAFFIINLILTL